MIDPDPNLLDRWEGRESSEACLEWRVPAVEFHRTLGSTNDRAQELLASGAPPWSVVISDEQTAGRGRGGRRWHSPPETGLWMSVLLRSPVSGVHSALPILAGVAVARAVERLSIQTRTGLKWPNDVYLDHRKVCGILAEAVLPGETPRGSTRARGGIVLGIGMNVHQRESDFPPDLDRPATSLGLAGARAVDRGDLAGWILEGLRSLLDPWPRRIPSGVLEEYARLDLLRGEPLEVRPGPAGAEASGVDRAEPGHAIGSAAGSEAGSEAGTQLRSGRIRAFRGVGDGIQPDGALRVLVREGDLPPGRVVEVRSGSVRLLSDPGAGGV